VTTRSQRRAASDSALACKKDRFFGATGVKNKYVIQIFDGGSATGYVGKRTLRYDRKKDRLLADYAVVENASDAKKYLTKPAAEKFAADFNSDAEAGVNFKVMKTEEKA